MILDAARQSSPGAGPIAESSFGRWRPFTRPFRGVPQGRAAVAWDAHAAEMDCRRDRYTAARCPRCARESTTRRLGFHRRGVRSPGFRRRVCELFTEWRSAAELQSASKRTEDGPGSTTCRRTLWSTYYQPKLTPRSARSAVCPASDF